MDERIVKFRVGVMVISSWFIFAILVALFGNVQSLLRPKITVHVRFVEAPGVAAGTSVRKSGVVVGRVTKVEFMDSGEVLVTCQIDAAAPVEADDHVSVGNNLLGEATVNFVSTRKAQAPPEPVVAPEVPANQGTRAEEGPPAPLLAQVQRQPLKSGDVIPPEGQKAFGSLAGDPMQALQRLEEPIRNMVESVTDTSQKLGDLKAPLQELVVSVTNTSNELKPAIEKLNMLLDDNAESLTATLDAVRSVATSFDEMLKDPAMRADMKRSLAELPQTLQESRRAFAGLQQTLDLANRNLQNMEGFTKPLGVRGEATFNQLDRSGAKLEALLDELTVFARQINNRQGTLGRLVNDPELYDNMTSAAANIDQLTREIKPLLYDVRVFTDKIARDPGSLGARGIFQQKTGIK